MTAKCYELDKDEIRKCIPVLRILRPQYTETELFSQVIKLTQTTGYRICCIENDSIKSVAGFRVGEWLHRGRYLEIEDFVTCENDRSKGYGSQLFDYIVEIAKREKCNQVRLVSGISRREAHKFYQAKKNMIHEASYFSLTLDS